MKEYAACRRRKDRPLTVESDASPHRGNSTTFSLDHISLPVWACGDAHYIPLSLLFVALTLCLPEHMLGWSVAGRMSQRRVYCPSTITLHTMRLRRDTLSPMLVLSEPFPLPKHRQCEEGTMPVSEQRWSSLARIVLIVAVVVAGGTIEGEVTWARILG